VDFPSLAPVKLADFKRVFRLTRLEFPDEEKPMEETWHVKVPRE